MALSGLRGPIARHAHATAAVIVALDRPLSIEADGRSREVQAALLAPGFEHALELRGGRLGVFLLPPGRRSTASVTELAPGPWRELSQSLTRFDSFEAVDRALGASAPRPLDARLSAAMAHLANSVDQNLSIEELASSVGLSATRLMTLAREHLGTSLRSWRRWMRAFEVARAYANGGSLTTAALDAGFASSSHLSSAARQDFGIAPSQVLTPRVRPRIVSLRGPARTSRTVER